MDGSRDSEPQIFETRGRSVSSFVSFLSFRPSRFTRLPVHARFPFRAVRNSTTSIFLRREINLGKKTLIHVQMRGQARAVYAALMDAAGARSPFYLEGYLHVVHEYIVYAEIARLSRFSAWHDSVAASGDHYSAAARDANRVGVRNECLSRLRD